METYTIFFGSSSLATVSGTEYAYEAYSRAKALAELLDEYTCLVCDETGNVLVEFDPEADDLTEQDYEDYGPIECGFDPYEGCYTFDC